MNKNNKWIIFLGALVLLSIFIGTIFFSTSDIGKEPLSMMKKSEENKQEVIKRDVEKDKSKKTDKKVEDIATVVSYKNLITPVGRGNKEYPVENSGTLLDKLKKYAESGEVDSLIFEVEKLLTDYRFSDGTNLDIAGLYGDASFTKGLIGKNDEEISNSLKGAYKTPEMLAIMPLYLSEESRRGAIRDELSLSPLAEGPWNMTNYKTIESKEEADKDEFKSELGVATSMFNVIGGLDKIHVISMNRDLDPDVHVLAYISELKNGKLELYGYYVSDEQEHYYQTVEFFKSLDEDLLTPNTEYHDELIQEELNKGNLPSEVLDDFLGSN